MSQFKQSLIINFALQNGDKVSLDQAINTPGVNTYYCNERFHVGNILSRMVKNGNLRRIKRGLFEINRIPIEYKDQPKLF